MEFEDFSGKNQQQLTTPVELSMNGFSKSEISTCTTHVRYRANRYLLRLPERLRSIVVCLWMSARNRTSPEPHARSLPNFCACFYVRGSVLLRHVDDRPHCLSAGRGDGSAQRGRSVIYDYLVIPWTFGSRKCWENRFLLCLLHAFLLSVRNALR